MTAAIDGLFAESPEGDPHPGLLFYCQHSLGIGHLMRSFALCQALSARYRVRLLCGGRIPQGIVPPGGFEVIALPPIAANLDFSLVSHDAAGDLEQTFERRVELIVEQFRALRPAVVVVELFPFGRKKFSRELLPLLEAAREPPRPLVVCSLRDLLVGRADQQEHDERASRIANAYFDALLVHADPRFARLEETFHPRSPLRIPVLYTGYVVRADADVIGCSEDRRPVVVVSVGSGAQGEALLTAAARAQPEILETTGLTMRMIAGPHVREDVWERLLVAATGQPGLDLVRLVPSLVPELRRARVSVSHCGYNTILEVLRTGVPALIVPAIEEGDQERERARRLEKLGLVHVLPRERLDPQSLATEVRATLGSPRGVFNLDVDGARASVEILAKLEAMFTPAADRGVIGGGRRRDSSSQDPTHAAGSPGRRRPPSSAPASSGRTRR